MTPYPDGSLQLPLIIAQLVNIDANSQSLYAFIPPPNVFGVVVVVVVMMVMGDRGILDSRCPSVSPSICRRHGFRGVTQVCFTISISNPICMLFVAMDRSLLILSDDTGWIFRFPDSNFSLDLISSLNSTLTSLGWLPYWIFQYLDSVGGMVSGANLLWNCNSEFHIYVVLAKVPSLLIFRDVTFKMAAWKPFWIF